MLFAMKAKYSNLIKLSKNSTRARIHYIKNKDRRSGNS